MKRFTGYILDAQAGEVRAFGSDGRHLRTFGRSGRGLAVVTQVDDVPTVVVFHIVRKQS